MTNPFPHDALDIHPASPDEVLAAHRNVHPHWSRGRSIEEHLRFRLNSPSHRRAKWFVGCVNGEVVVSLGRYPMQFQVRGQVMPGCAIGSVYTVEAYRQRGLAAQLVSWVDARGTGEGLGISILYSDIDPGYYAKLGYRLCPSHEGWCNPHESRGSGRSSQSPLRLVAFSAADALERSEMATLYEAYHGAALFSIVRDEAYWQSIIARFPDDRYFWLQEPEGGRAGYARVQQQGATCRVTDFALANQSDELACEFYEAVNAAAREWGAEKLGGWLAHEPVAAHYFSIAPRMKEITMAKPLAFAGEFDARIFAAADRFCEVDHV